MHDTYNTLSDLNDLMYKIGCFNKNTADTYVHNKYINESIETEDWHAGDRRKLKQAFKDEDHNVHIVMTSSYAILYNASKSRDLPSMLEKGPSWEFCSKHAYGKGVYCNFQEYQAHNSAWIDRQGYGDTLVKYRYNGNICRECLVFEPQLWGKSGTLSEQIKHFNGLEAFFQSCGYSGEMLDKICKSHISSIAVQVILKCCERKLSQREGHRKYHQGMTFGTFYGSHCDDVLMHYGVQGMLYMGDTDGPVAIIFNTDKLDILAYYTVSRKGREEDDEIKWIKVPQGKGTHQGTSDIRDVLNFFNKKYEANPMISRPYCGELLVKDIQTKKWAFLDMNKAKQIIYNGLADTPNLFGDFEFEMAQDFSKIGGKEMAFVQLDKDEKSQFLIDKEGNLYREPNGKPFSNIRTYYPNENEPMNNDVEDDTDIDFGDDEDFEIFKKQFGESIQRIIKESLQDEGRTETQDGHVELDNFDVARKIMKFNGDDNAYFVQLAERHKDHPDRRYEHNACDYKDYFEVTSIEHLNAIEPVIKRLCQKGEWRAMLYINPRPMGDTREYAHNVLEPRFKRHNSHMQGHEVEVAYGQSKDWDNRPLCFVDVDNDNPQVHKQVLDYISKIGIKPLEMYNTTNNGLHIILPDKEEARKLDFSFLDKGKQLGRWATAGVEIDKSITLYAYVKAKGYGAQQRMQQKLGGR